MSILDLSVSATGKKITKNIESTLCFLCATDSFSSISVCCQFQLSFSLLLKLKSTQFPITQEQEHSSISLSMNGRLVGTRGDF
jgi:hypothetical protein